MEQSNKHLIGFIHFDETLILSILLEFNNTFSPKNFVLIENSIVFNEDILEKAKSSTYSTNSPTTIFSIVLFPLNASNPIIFTG